ncbi:MAG: hypothetical protein JO166_17280 [Deltaproteobacteria bacterium]|nr:hypothetical protein [Deltaproteobacteria bacterium]
MRPARGEHRNLCSHVLRAAGVPGSLLLASFWFASCQQPKPLPEQGTYAQQLYVQKCGVCHRPYSPASMTPAMWEMQVEAMRLKIAQAGRPPLTPEQHLAILDYLKRNAGSQ